ncbi:MAG: hypothetical protein JWO02_3012 [Solirubrobacterales bacterium]|nr:hypothetical protein [Solirubrobacterales bacterium]
MSLALTLALTATKATIGLVVIFFVVFPALAHVLIGVAMAQVLGERDANERYRHRLED